MDLDTLNNAPFEPAPVTSRLTGDGKGLAFCAQHRSKFTVSQIRRLAFIGRYRNGDAGIIKDVIRPENAGDEPRLDDREPSRVFNVDDSCGRGDGMPVYNYTLTNCVVTAPGAQFTSNYVGSLFTASPTRTNNPRPFVASIVTVSNADQSSCLRPAASRSGGQ